MSENYTVPGQCRSVHDLKNESPDERLNGILYTVLKAARPSTSPVDPTS